MLSQASVNLRVKTQRWWMTVREGGANRYQRLSSLWLGYVNIWREGTWFSGLSFFLITPKLPRTFHMFVCVLTSIMLPHIVSALEKIIIRHEARSLTSHPEDLRLRPNSQSFCLFWSFILQERSNTDACLAQGSLGNCCHLPAGGCTRMLDGWKRSTGGTAGKYVADNAGAAVQLMGWQLVFFNSSSEATHQTQETGNLAKIFKR